MIILSLILNLNLSKKTDENGMWISSDVEIGSRQPDNTYTDLLLLPKFAGVVRHICILESHDENSYI